MCIAAKLCITVSQWTTTTSTAWNFVLTCKYMHSLSPRVTVGDLNSHPVPPDVCFAGLNCQRLNVKKPIKTISHGGKQGAKLLFGFWQRRIISICEFKIDSWEDSPSPVALCSRVVASVKMTIDQLTITTYQFHMGIPGNRPGPKQIVGESWQVLRKFCWLCEAPKVSVLSLSFGIPLKKNLTSMIDWKELTNCIENELYTYIYIYHNPEMSTHK